jgi:hypothetical protein
MLGYTKLANMEKRMEKKIHVLDDENATTTHWAGGTGGEGGGRRWECEDGREVRVMKDGRGRRGRGGRVNTHE